MEKNKLSIQNQISNEEIKNLIYTIRGKQVMLDSDVARLYNYQTKRVNETVSRNKERFPENFCFRLTEEEVKNLKRQTAILNLGQENTGRKLRPVQKMKIVNIEGKNMYLMYLQNKE